MVWRVINQRTDGLAPNFYGPDSDVTNRTPVTEDNVMGLPEVHNATLIFSSKLAMIDCPFYEKTPNGRVKREDYPGYSIFNGAANKWQTSYSLKQRWFADMRANMGGFVILERDDKFDPVAGYNVPPENVSITALQNKRSGLIDDVIYTVGTQPYASDDVLHLKNLTVGYGEKGYDSLWGMHDAYSLALNTLKFATKYFENGTHVYKYIKIGGWLNDRQKAEMKSNVQEWTGARNAHKVLPLYGGSEIGSLPIDEQGTMNDAREANVGMIANALGVNPAMLGMQQASYYNSIQENEASQMINAYAPIFAQANQEISKKMVRLEDRGRIYAEFDRRQILEADPTSHIKSLALQVSNGLMSRERACELLNQTTDMGTESYWMPSTAQQINPNAPRVEPAPQLQVQAPASPPNAQVARSQELLEATLDNFRTRLVKTVEGGRVDVTSHFPVIRAKLKSFPVEMIEADLNNMEAELMHVLPEQRKTVVEAWDIAKLAKELNESN